MSSISTPDESQAASKTFLQASRKLRLAACLLDGWITGIPILLLTWGLLALCGFRLLEPIHGVPRLLLALGFIGIEVGVFLAINGYLLVRHGQTVGKRLAGIHIVRRNGSPATLWDLFALRSLPLLIAFSMPLLGGLLGLLDALLVFGNERLCLHDRVAGTQVVMIPAALPTRGSDPQEIHVPEEPSVPVPDAVPGEEAPLAAAGSPLEICPYCAEMTSADTNACRGCGRNPFTVDGVTANRSLTLEELLKKAGRLQQHGNAREALETHTFATMKFPVAKEAWMSLRDAPYADPGSREKATRQIEKIDRMLRGEPEA